MSADSNKKTGRTFQCRDVLWETFEQMARELECSVDYLINEAMKQYARQRNYGNVRGSASAARGEPSGERTSGLPSPPPPAPAVPPPAVRPPPLGGGLPPLGGGTLRLP